jgi:hypothetical protein
MRYALICCALACAPLAAADGLRDPTRPPEPKAQRSGVHESAPVLSAIIGSAAGRIAIFNGQLVRSGGSVGSYSIEAVFVDGVRYRHAGRTQELYLPRAGSIKRSSTDPVRVAGGAH